jgi:hypothetical protein
MWGKSSPGFHLPEAAGSRFRRQAGFSEEILARRLAAAYDQDWLALSAAQGGLTVRMFLKQRYSSQRLFLNARSCKEKDHGQRPVTRKQGNEEAKTGETARPSGWWFPCSAQNRQAFKG